MSEECEVMLGEYDGDEAEQYVEQKAIAVGRFQCFECDKTIEKGAEHDEVVGVWDGKPETYRFCSPCWEILNEFSDGPKTFGVMWEEFSERWDEGAHIQACLNRVNTVAAKRKLTEQYRLAKNLDKL